MSSKRYRLLKTLPDSIPGDIYIWNESQKAYYKDGNVLGSYWTTQYVENNPEWFEPIPDTPEPAKEGFVWTDKLVKEFIIDRNNGKPYAPAYVDSYINKFKASKQLQQKEEPIQEGDWEIVSWNHVRTGGVSNMPSMHDNDPVEIHSVRRLSDGEVFSVGDEVSSKHFSKDVITGFFISDGEMWVSFASNNCIIYWLTKPSTNSPKEERIEVVSLQLHDRFLGNGADTYWYQFSTNRTLNGEKFSLIKKAIEDVLNSNP